MEETGFKPDRIRSRREALGLSHDQLDERAGLLPGRSGQFERGMLRPTPSELHSVIEVLQVNSAWLHGETEDWILTADSKELALAAVRAKLVKTMAAWTLVVAVIVIGLGIWIIAAAAYNKSPLGAAVLVGGLVIAAGFTMLLLAVCAELLISIEWSLRKRTHD